MAITYAGRNGFYATCEDCSAVTTYDLETDTFKTEGFVKDEEKTYCQHCYRLRIVIDLVEECSRRVESIKRKAVRGNSDALMLSSSTFARISPALSSAMAQLHVAEKLLSPNHYENAEEKEASDDRRNL